jgi:flagellar hook-associated protein 3 FlgL
VPQSSSQITVPGHPPILQGSDPNPQEANSVFNTLTRLQLAIASGNAGQIQRASALLKNDFDRLNFARASIGTQLQTVDALQTRLGNNNTQLQSSLSAAIDVNLPQVISDMTAEQASFQASLQLTARVFQLSLLNYM